MNKHLITTDQFKDRKEIERLFKIADRMKTPVVDKYYYGESLKDRTVSTLFFEPSTRTRFSFEKAALALGANVISEASGKTNMSSVKGETLEDTIRTVAEIISQDNHQASAIVLRHMDDDSAVRAARTVDAMKEKKVSIICAGAGKAEHPTQALLDLYTLKQCKGKIDGTSIAIMGDLKYGRTTHSLTKLLTNFEDIDVYSCAVDGFEMPKEYIDLMASKGINYTECKNIEDIPPHVTALYMTRVQDERLNGELQNERFVSSGMKLTDYKLDLQKLSRFSAETLVMHPLPRCNELSPEIDVDPRAAYWKQVSNGVPVRKAVLHHYLDGREMV